LVPGSASGRIDFNFLDPWPSDDDTDIEFIYLWTMADAEDIHLSPQSIQQAWYEHTRPEEYICVSNLVAQRLMRGSPAVLPPSTSLFAANDQSLMIDAQLTTEIFGALAPGMPAEALELADLPISVTASGYAAHAAQFFVVLYSIAPLCDPALPGADKALWLVDTARRFLPDGSKAADVIDAVREDHATNPDRDDWERTRDLIATRFQSQATENGYRYLAWYESAVNLAGAVIALLYGENDLRRTIRIAALSGWDSDNGTASMGGLLGLLNGTQYVRDAFPDRELSMSYYIGRSRVGFDPNVVDFEDIADRMLPLVTQAICEAGGSVREDGRYTLPGLDLDSVSAETHNPRVRVHLASMNNTEGVLPRVIIQGGVPEDPTGRQVAPDAALADGLEFDGSGGDRQLWVRYDFSPGQPAEPHCAVRSGVDEVVFTVTWAFPETLTAVSWVEGWSTAEGGWLEDLAVEVRIDGTWTAVALDGDYDPGRDLAFEIHTLPLASDVVGDGIRVRGRPGGEMRYVTACELDAVKR